MDYRLRLVSLKCAIKVILLRDITLNERTPLQRVAMAPRQIIKRDRLKSVSRQQVWAPMNPAPPVTRIGCILPLEPLLLKAGLPATETLKRLAKIHFAQLQSEPHSSPRTMSGTSPDSPCLTAYRYPV
jgi:hypothetical protein